jgi:endonuclease/exonuclease/phosphatase family metal-dependent hydrolase
MSYNVENLFDDRDDGTEYAEYDPGSGDWDTSLYHAKLKNVAEAIQASEAGMPDICLLQEVENQRVVTDLVEGFLNVLKYRYVITAPQNGAATTVALLSKFEPEEVFVHRVIHDEDIMLRPILEVYYDMRGEGLVLFNNHWKSKYGGAKATEVYRVAAAGFIRDRVREIRSKRPDICVVVAGDLNERVDEYRAIGEEYRTALMVGGDEEEGTLRLTGSWEEAENDPGLFFSPWLETHFKGSYAYKGSWERIDHFLIACPVDGNGFFFEDFEVIDEHFLLNEDGFPRRWSIHLADGYSDHLPILLTLSR